MREVYLYQTVHVLDGECLCLREHLAVLDRWSRTLFGVATVAGILGHSQPSTTLDIYTHAFDKNKKAASAGLQGMLEI